MYIRHVRALRTWWHLQSMTFSVKRVIKEYELNRGAWRTLRVTLSLSPSSFSLIHPQCRGRLRLRLSQTRSIPWSSRAVNYSVRIAEKLEELCRDACAGPLDAEIKPATRGSPAIQITCHGETGFSFHGVTRAHTAHGAAHRYRYSQIDSDGYYYEFYSR